MKPLLSGTWIVIVCLATYGLVVAGKVQAEESDKAPPYRGIYIDKFTTILGNASREDSVLRWCVGHGFNAISLYDLKDIIGRPGAQDSLARFIRKARLDYGIAEIAAVRGIEQDYEQTAQYDQSRYEPSERFTAYNLENEWWNGGPDCDFGCYTRILEQMQRQARATTPPKTTEAYIGWFINPDQQEAKQARTLVRHLDRIMVHAYRKVPEFGYLRERLMYLGQEAQKQNRTLDVIVLFSAEPEFMADYYRVTDQNHTFEASYQNLVDQFTKADFDGKANIRLIGYQLFAYTFASAARPHISKQ
ncbi:hypothetical protein [Telluribacter sp. SYSU D00476]|uniref:hypothetical protein n=1 Tax=Telluribacter sp. SYSU D00476 TaxID=2811430 RepID=UPI001FF56E1C|nr:hypothetical protein [Telluribacter sp. SYSU D00476]